MFLLRIGRARKADEVRERLNTLGGSQDTQQECSKSVGTL
jgi:hypothetical protein